MLVPHPFPSNPLRCKTPKWKGPSCSESQQESMTAKGSPWGWCHLTCAGRTEGTPGMSVKEFVDAHFPLGSSSSSWGWNIRTLISHLGRGARCLLIQYCPEAPPSAQPGLPCIHQGPRVLLPQAAYALTSP